jgi:N-acetyl-gamma-glutamyl-phosphate reductase
MEVGVFGATGYSGREAVRILARHPRARVAFTTGTGGGHVPHEKALERPADAYLLALPHGVSAKYAAQLRASRPQAIVVDLSGDLRLDSAGYVRWYGHAHPAPELLGTAPYGLTEVNRAQLAGARLVSNPGCYATSVLLPLYPLLREGLVKREGIVIDAKSGATGAGKALREDLLFCEMLDDFSAYAPGRAHRHVPEMENVLQLAAGGPVPLTFCPHLLPVRRGILSTIYVEPTAPLDQLGAALRSFYAGSPFVTLVEAPPRLSDVVNTNACRMSLHEGAPGRAVLFSALDNLVKGAAGQAVQNLNVAAGFAETDGLLEGL